MDDRTCDEACLILSKTRDGDKLTPAHLKLVELACNGYLNARGRRAFHALAEYVAVAPLYDIREAWVVIEWFA